MPIPLFHHRPSSALHLINLQPSSTRAMPIPTENGHHRPASSHRHTRSTSGASTTTSYPAPFIINPTGPHTHTLILLHGRGDSGPSFGSLFYTSSTSSDFRLAALYPGLKFIFPTTAARWSERFRHHMTEWFDGPAEEGLAEGVAWIHGILREELETAGIPAGNVFLGGISQGAAVALWTALTWPGDRLGGLVAMSTWLPRGEALWREWCGGDDDEPTPGDETTERHVGGGELAQRQEAEPTQVREPDERTVRALTYLRRALPVVKELEGGEEASEAEDGDTRVLGMPVFLGHGDADEVVAYTSGRRVYELLTKCLGMGVTWRRYRDYGHWYKQPEEIDDIIAFLGERCGLLPS